MACQVPVPCLTGKICQLVAFFPARVLGLRVMTLRCDTTFLARVWGLHIQHAEQVSKKKLD